MKKLKVPILFTSGLVVLFMLVNIYRMVMGIMVYEQQDVEVLSRIYEISITLNQFKNQNHSLPYTLSDAGINDNICVGMKCFHVKYKVVNNGRDFTLAANTNYPFVAFAYSDWANMNESPYGRGGIGLVEAYRGSRTDLPRYKQDTQHFATPSAWPELTNGNFFEKNILLPIW